MGMRSVVTGGYVRVNTGQLLKRSWFPASMSDDDYHKLVAKEVRSECKALEAQIRRHVDDYGSTEIVIETEKQCEYCGSCWTEAADAAHNGGCCPRDEAAMLASEGTE